MNIRFTINVVADGVHSRLRASIVGEDGYVAKKTGLTCYRIAISVDDAKKALGDLPLPHWWEPTTCQNRTSMISSTDGRPRMVIAYPLRHQTYFNLSCIVRAPGTTRSTTDSWHIEGDRSKMFEYFADFSEPFRLILRQGFLNLRSTVPKANRDSAATEVKYWELQDLETLPTWTKGRAMLIGDAAHAMTPMQGQGANMSIEDAEGLRLLVPGTCREDVPDILKLVETVRKPRVTRVQADTRRSRDEFAGTAVDESGSGSSFAESWDRYLEFNYGYNGIHSALKTWLEVNPRP